MAGIDVKIIPKTVRGHFHQNTNNISNYQNCVFTTNRRYINLTGKDVQLALRNGMVVKLPNVPTDIRHCILIEDQYVLPTEAYMDHSSYFGIINPVEGTELKIITDSFSNAYITNRNRHNTLIIKTESKITTDELSEDHTSYFVDKDISVSLTPHYSNVLPHPYSDTAIATEMFKAMNTGFKGLNFHIELIDNDSKLGSRFINFNGDAHEVIPVKDLTKLPGAYLVINNTVPGKESIISEKSDLEEMQVKLGLYKTIEEAISGGDAQSLLTSKIIQLQHDNAMENARVAKLNLENQQIKAEYEREAIINKQKLLEAESEVKRLSMLEKERSIETEKQMLALKSQYESKKYERDDYYDSRSASRKESTEYIKMIPAVISLAALAFALFK